jgi:hypothetical protein
MNKRILEREIDGKVVGFRFNMLALGKACQLENCSVDELYKRLGMTVKNIGTKEVPNMVQEQPTDLIAINNFFYASAIVYKEGNGEKVDFTAIDVSDWLEHFDMNELLMIAFKTPDLKNTEAPTTGQSSSET